MLPVIWEAIAKVLSPLEREVLASYITFEMSIGEIASELQMTEQEVTEVLTIAVQNVTPLAIEHLGVTILADEENTLSVLTAALRELDSNIQLSERLTKNAVLSFQQERETMTKQNEPNKQQQQQQPTPPPLSQSPSEAHRFWTAKSFISLAAVCTVALVGGVALFGSGDRIPVDGSRTAARVTSFVQGDAWFLEAQDGPHERVGAAMVYNAPRREVLMYGGSTPDGRMSYADLWAFSVATGEWTER
jgi:predicted DNA-binding protein YlxM (UPF0122 family)